MSLDSPNPYIDSLLNAIKEEDINAIKTILNKNFLEKIEIKLISNTAYNYVSTNGNLEIANFLISHDFKLNQQQYINKRIKTPLHVSCEYGHLNMVKFLIDNFKIKLNQRDNLNMTPLHWAVEYEHVDIVDYLLNNYLNEIDFDSTDKFNRTIYDLALINNNKKLCCMIADKIKSKTTNNHNNTSSPSNVNNFFNKTQFNIKSFAKPLKSNYNSTAYNSVINSEATRDTTRNIIELENDNDDEPVKSINLSVSPNTLEMDKTLNWLETQIFTQNNIHLNDINFNFNSLSSVDLIDEIDSGRELVLTEAGKQLLKMMDENKSNDDDLLSKVAKSFENNSKNVNNKDDNDDDDDNDDVLSDDSMITKAVKKCRFSDTSPNSPVNHMDISNDLFGFLSR